MRPVAARSSIVVFLLLTYLGVGLLFYEIGASGRLIDKTQPIATEEIGRQQAEPMKRPAEIPTPTLPTAEARPDMSSKIAELEAAVEAYVAEIAELKRREVWKERVLLEFLKSSPLETDIECLQRASSSTDPKEMRLVHSMLVGGLRSRELAIDNVARTLGDNNFGPRDVSAICYAKMMRPAQLSERLVDSYSAARFPYGLGAALALLELDDPVLLESWKDDVTSALHGAQSEAFARRLFAMIRRYPVPELTDTLELIGEHLDSSQREEAENIVHALKAHPLR